MFVIVRHGNTFDTGEQPRRIGARTDLPLTEQGMVQADTLGRHFAGLGWEFSRAIVSPLARTRQTADAILAMQENPPNPQPAEFLREIDHGPDENKTEEEVLERIGTDALAAWESQASPPQGWIVNPAARIAAWQELFRKDQFQNERRDNPLLLVTSNGAARFALRADPLLCDQAQNLPSLKLPTGGYGVITRGRSGQLHLESWGIRP